jgi:hypothetical protein
MAENWPKPLEAEDDKQDEEQLPKMTLSERLKGTAEELKGKLDKKLEERHARQEQEDRKRELKKTERMLRESEPMHLSICILRTNIVSSFFNGLEEPSRPFSSDERYWLGKEMENKLLEIDKNFFTKTATEEDAKKYLEEIRKYKQEMLLQLSNSDGSLNEGKIQAKMHELKQASEEIARKSRSSDDGYTLRSDDFDD